MKAIIKVLTKLKKSGFTAYLAGGAVRDLILVGPRKTMISLLMPHLIKLQIYSQKLKALEKSLG